MRLPGITSFLSTKQETKSLYRIMHFDHLAEWFETGRYPLLSPDKWEDPFEKLLKEAVFPKSEQVPYTKGQMFGLCFTWDGTSDALWRVYSPIQYGIRIRTTPERLAKAISVAPELVGGRSFVGEVEYRFEKELVAHAKGIRAKLEASKDTAEVARTMLLKRKPFAYEKEVRVIHLTSHAPASDGNLYFSIDPHEVIQTILIDPRAPDNRFKTLKRYFDQVGKFKGSINQSSIYKMPSLNGK